MKVLFDLNIVLDMLLDRVPWAAEAQPIMRRVLNGSLDGYVNAASVPTLFYVARRSVGDAGALKAVQLCLRTFEITPVTRFTLEQAALLPGCDFEDNVQVAAAVEAGMDVIITRDAGFKDQTVRVMTPAELEHLLSNR